MVLWHLRDEGQVDTSYQRLVALLDIDLFWLYRFSLGFDQGRAISIIDPVTYREIRRDEVGLEGVRIARGYAR